MIFAKEFSLETAGRFDAVDITDDVRSIVSSSGIVNGNALVFCPHTTCSLVISTRGEDLTASLTAAMQALAPPDGYYAHDDMTIRTENLVADEPANAPAHLLNAVMGKVSETIPVVGGEIAIGDEQQILFVELDSSRARRYLIQVAGE